MPLAMPILIVHSTLQYGVPYRSTLKFIKNRKKNRKKSFWKKILGEKQKKTEKKIRKKKFLKKILGEFLFQKK